MSDNLPPDSKKPDPPSVSTPSGERSTPGHSSSEERVIPRVAAIALAACVAFFGGFEADEFHYGREAARIDSLTTLRDREVQSELVQMSSREEKIEAEARELIHLNKELADGLAKQREHDDEMQHELQEFRMMLRSVGYITNSAFQVTNMYIYIYTNGPVKLTP